MMFYFLLLAQEIMGQNVLSDYHRDRLRLHDKLFKDYRREIPSLYLGRSGRPPIPMNCNLTLAYANLLSIDEPQQTAKMIIDIVYEWADSRLSWDPAEFGGIENIVVMIKGLIWTPDVLPYDIYSYTDTLPEEQRAVAITHTGAMKMYQSAVVDFVCHMNLVDFPFDTQSCTLKLCSFVALSTEIHVDAVISPDIDMSGMGNGEWSYVNMSSSRSLSSWGPGEEYWIVNFNFQFSRTTTYYISIIIIPSFILTFLSVSGLFWGAIIGASNMETLNLGFAAILAMMFVLQMATQDMPRINQIDKLSKYSMVNLGLITLASVGVVIISKLECLCRKKTLGPRRELHAVLLVAFICVTIANFCFLVTKTELDLATAQSGMEKCYLIVLACQKTAPSELVYACFERENISLLDLADGALADLAIAAYIGRFSFSIHHVITIISDNELMGVIIMDNIKNGPCFHLPQGVEEDSLKKDVGPEETRAKREELPKKKENKPKQYSSKARKKEEEEQATPLVNAHQFIWSREQVDRIAAAPYARANYKDTRALW